MISNKKAEAIIDSKKECYTAMLFAQYLLPDFKDKIMTKKFLKGIRFGKYWMPKATELTRQAICAYPPTKEILSGIVYDLLLGFKSSDNPDIDASVRRTAIQVKKKPPCKRWMLAVIG